MAEVRNLGLPKDIHDRVALARTDDRNRRSSIAAARARIYENNCGVTSKPMLRLLNGESLHPIAVRIQPM
jgi:hypothetical protein